MHKMGTGMSFQDLTQHSKWCIQWERERKCHPFPKPRTICSQSPVPKQYSMLISHSQQLSSCDSLVTHIFLMGPVSDISCFSRTTLNTNYTHKAWVMCLQCPHDDHTHDSHIAVLTAWLGTLTLKEGNNLLKAPWLMWASDFTPNLM